MKKTLALLLAATLFAALAIQAPAEISSSLGEYKPGKISGIDVEPIGDLDVSLGGYETHEIEDLDVGSLGGLDVSLGGYETHEIEDVDVGSLDELDVSLGSYVPNEITGIDLEPIRALNIDLGGYEGLEIHGLDVKPLEEIQSELAEYSVPDISGIAPAELMPLYLSMVSYMGNDQRARLAGLSEIEVASLVEKQYELIADLNAAFASAGIHCSIDPYSGRIPIDATLLYDTDEYQVTDAGKQILSGVFRVYCAVLSQEKYRDFISDVMVIGHTDSDGSYDYNVTLSQKRAEAVREFCLSDECGVDDAAWLASRLVAEGHSYDERIFNADGSENKAASRRVELGFTVTAG